MFHPPLDAISSLSEQPQVYQSDTGNTLRSQDDTSDEGFCDGDSDYSSSDIECEGEWENGRFYCPDGYHFPIDDQQHEVELLIHNIWTKHSPVGQELFLAPVNTREMHNVLDIGSGPCYWVEDFAVKYPHTTVTGIDLFPHEVMAPPNVKLRKDDVELPWPAQNKYELVHSRDMVLAIRDWDTLLSRAFQSLVPGGSIELQEIHYSPQSNDGSVHSTAQPLADFFSKIARGLKVLHVDLHAITLLAEKMRAAGFVNVTTNISYIPISRNAQSETENETENDAATWMKSAMYCGLQGTALGPLTRGLGWESEEVEVYLIGVRNCLRESLQDTKLPMYIIHAQRP
ncbi:hypothetical protein VE00_07900 [Pseudogymnoascus sp. WSF 3629]|nr:hypothetical protein VE00_07900 [Pseudogymnoascus sp. WSF 3629]